MAEPNPVGALLKSEADKRGWNIDSVAAVVGMSESSVRNHLRGRATLSALVAVYYAAAFSMEPMDILKLQNDWRLRNVKPRQALPPLKKCQHCGRFSREAGGERG